jgi:tRNA(Ile)-lysidine synthetase-like protein
MATPSQFKHDWFNHPEWWFSATHEYDQLITSKYVHLLDVAEEGGCDDPLTSILIFDQLSRHVYRNKPNGDEIIKYCLERAMFIVTMILDTPYERSLQAQEWTFFMLPLRHTKEPSNITLVLERTWQRLMSDKDMKNGDVYKRFLKATYARFLNDHPDQWPLMDVYMNIPTEQSDPSMFKDLLAFTPSHYNMVENIVDAHLIGKDLKARIKTNKPIIISLSGGVDSMVCSYALKHYLGTTSPTSQTSPDENITAVHINYDNRPQCVDEVMFLKQWCAHLGITLHVRTIKEIHRKPCMEYELRDLYETYTRDVRYQSYKSLVECDYCDDSDDIQVILGHNQDDCLENIMTNIAQKNKYDNLRGMSVVSEQDNITFIRPLLNVSKDDIIAFAHSNNIPYLPNSTPVWSQRGQIRNSIVPCLDKWDARFVPSMFELSDKMTGLYQLLNASVSQFINKGKLEVVDGKQTFTIETLPCKELVSIDMFWKEFFASSAFKYHVSAKSVRNLLECIEKFQQSITRTQKGETRRVMVAKHLCFAMTKMGGEDMIKLKIY